LRRRVLLTLGFNPGITIVVSNNVVGDSLGISLDSGVRESTTNKTLGGIDSVGRVNNGLMRENGKKINNDAPAL
jgi:NAD-specific glutamate dehydrogenase